MDATVFYLLFVIRAVNQLKPKILSRNRLLRIIYIGMSKIDHLLENSTLQYLRSSVP